MTISEFKQFSKGSNANSAKTNSERIASMSDGLRDTAVLNFTNLKRINNARNVEVDNTVKLKAEMVVGMTVYFFIFRVA